MLHMSESNISWEMGGQPLIIKKNRVKVIKRRCVRIYPFLELNKFLNYGEMFSLANTLASHLKNKNIDCDILKKNTYTFELHGSWNVVLSLKYTKDETEFCAMFAIIHCPYYKKTYFCPFYNIEYVSLNHHSINCHSSSTQFKILEDEIKTLLDVKYIDSFPNSPHLL